MAFVKGHKTWNKGLKSNSKHCIKCGCFLGKKEHLCKKPYNLGKTKKDYPNLANSGRKVGSIPWNKLPPNLCIDCGRQLSNQKPRYCRIHALWGDRNYQWKGGPGGIIHAIRTSTKYYKWKWEVAKRDKYRCQNCGIGARKEIKLEIDHILPLSYLIKNYNIKNKRDAYGCSPLWDTKNGRVLCKPCHVSMPTWGEKAKRFQL